MLVGFAAVVGAFGAAALMSAATAPTATADDFSDIVTAVNIDYGDGQAEFATALADFHSNEVASGLTSILQGLDDDFVAAPNNLAFGTLQALEGESPLTFLFPEAVITPTSFADALTLAQGDVTQGLADLGSVAAFLSGGSYDTALVVALAGVDQSSVFALEELLLGAATSF
jgi:hypothetical protein